MITPVLYLFLGILNGLDFRLTVTAGPAAASAAPETAAEGEGKPTPAAAPAAPAATAEPAQVTPECMAESGLFQGGH